MKNFYLQPLLCMMTISLVISSCTLDTETKIPTGATNEDAPVFASSGVISDTSNHFRVKARLSKRGNLTILQHGWVWSATPSPTLRDGKLELGSLGVDSFATEITGLDLGKLYYLRPFVSTGSDTIYGPEQRSFLGVGFTINTDTEIFRGADVKFTNHSAGNNTYLWDFGDGNTDTTHSPLHTFNTLGVITVRLTAKNGGGSVTRDISLKVIVNPFEGYWVSIAGGTFMMGCTPEQQPDCLPAYENPVHPVTLSPFFMGKTEITQGQWQSVTGINPSFWYDCGSDCPVETVSWLRIVNEFIPALYRKTGRIHRLPTEAEWEYAARGGNSSMGYKYAGGNTINTVAWHYGNAFSKTHPVAKKAANELGLYDMNGNVSEWCQDWYDVYSASLVENPQGPGFGIYRVVRSGDWSDNQIYCRVASRSNHSPETRSSSLGFRLVRPF